MTSPGSVPWERGASLLAVGSTEEDLSCLRSICAGAGWTLHEARGLQQARAQMRENTIAAVLWSGAGFDKLIEKREVVCEQIAILCGFPGGVRGSLGSRYIDNGRDRRLERSGGARLPGRPDGLVDDLADVGARSQHILRVLPHGLALRDGPAGVAHSFIGDRAVGG